MKKFLLAILIALFGVASHAQSVSDSALLTVNRWMITPDTVYQKSDTSDVVYTHEGFNPRKITFKKASVSGADLVIRIDSSLGLKMYEDQPGKIYYYYTAVILNNGKKINVAFRYIDNGTFDSVGLISLDDPGYMVVFWIQPTKSL